jgi:hypothetical protein
MGLREWKQVTNKLQYNMGTLKYDSKVLAYTKWNSELLLLILFFCKS